MNQSTTPARRTLLDISDDMIALDDLLMECGGDVSDPQVALAVEEFMNELNVDFTQKADGYAHLIAELTARSKARKEEADRMAARARIDETAAKWLKDRLKMVMIAHGVTKMETNRHRLTVANNGGKQTVEIDPTVKPEAMPPQYTTVIPIQIVPNPEKIREALEAGETLSFATLKPRGTHLIVK